MAHHAVLLDVGPQGVHPLRSATSREVVKQYFLSYNGALFNDFVLGHSAGETTLELLSRDLDEWQITFVDTGLTTTIGGRLSAVASHLGDDETFLATYGDGLTDAPLDDMIRTFNASGKTGMFLSVHTPFNAHLVDADDDGVVTGVHEMASADIRMNGGFFVFKRDVIDWIEPGEELVDEPFARLIARQELLAYRHDGFFLPMDTIKDRQVLESLHDSGEAPWRRLRAGGRGRCWACHRLSRSAASSRSAATRTTSRSGAAERSSRSSRRIRSSRSTGWCSRRPASAAAEARASAEAFLAGAAAARVQVHEFRDGFLPYVGGEVKEVFEDLKRRVDPQLVLTHASYDFHQDHRLACELTWNTFRDHLILEYEIPKFDGDLGRPNVFVPLAPEVVERKLALLEQHFPTRPASIGSTARRSSG